jgi:hypothetical protein
MEASDRGETHFYVQTLAIGSKGELVLLEPERIVVTGQPTAQEALGGTSA